MKENIVEKTRERYLEYERRHQDILSAAIKLFNTKGYAATTTAQIAKAAKVTEKTMYRHFNNKQDLFDECINSVVGQLGAKWQNEIDKDRDDKYIYMNALIKAYVSFVIENPDKSMFLIHLYSNRDTEELDDRFKKFLELILNETEKVIVKSREKGLFENEIFPEAHPRVLAGLLISQYFTMIFMNEMLPKDLFNEDIATTLVKKIMGID